jgi:molybdopterin molybdotransferase
MIEFEEAFGIVMEGGFETESEYIPFHNSCNRILDEDIQSDVDMPPFNKSAVDGYACNSTDLKHDLELIEIIAAGMVPLRSVGRDQCSKIMTGAIVPEGCNVVFMVEDAVKLDNGKIRFAGTDSKSNIATRASDVKTGDVVLRKGKYLMPHDIAVMASVGHTEVKVKKRPVVGIISTGDELISPYDTPVMSKIRNSNAYQLAAQVTRAGGTGIEYGIAPDNELKTFEMIQKALHECNIVLITGGVSMGDYDFVPTVLERLGVKILFNRVNVQPGKPTTFGVHSEALVFGLPGNPVSSFIQFELLVRPVINKMMGYNWKPFEYKLPLAEDYERKSTGRLGFIPVIIREMKVVPVDYHGSAHLTALSYADGIIAIKPEMKKMLKGEIVNVRQI